MSVVFIHSSTEIGKIIKNNSHISHSTDNRSQIKEIINEKNYNNISLNNWETMIFESNKNYSWSLKKNEIIEVIFPEINNNLDITIIDWWPIFYNYTTQSLSWILIQNESLFISQTGSLQLKNLWWYTTYNIDSIHEFITKTKKYEIKKKIWNKEVIKSSGEIKNF